MSGNPDIRYAHPSHEAFNKRFEPKPPVSDVDVNGPWLDASVLQNLPDVGRAFDRSRDNAAARENPGTKVAETQPRADKLEPALKPPRDQRKNADRDGWLTAQRDAVLARAHAPSHEPAPEYAREATRDLSVPSL